MRSFLLALLGSVSPKNTPNEVTNQELLDKVNALTLELNEVKKAQTQSNVHFLAMISESVKIRVKRYKQLKISSTLRINSIFKSIRTGYAENCRF